MGGQTRLKGSPSGAGRSVAEYRNIKMSSAITLAVLSKDSRQAHASKPAAKLGFQQKALTARRESIGYSSECGREN